MNRPEYISKLAFYLHDKEPLVYLFIINSDFFEDKDNQHLPSGSPAGVLYKNRRVSFYYNEKLMSGYKAKELYFVVLHEAYHIFKKHLQRHVKFKNRLMANIAEDMIINEEINDSHFFYGLVPKCPVVGAKIPDKFKDEYKNLGKDAYVTERLYHWLMNQKIKKEDLLQNNSYVRIKDTDKYGRIQSSRNGKYKVQKMSKDEMLDEINGGEKKNNSNVGIYTKDELIPIVYGDKSGEGIPCDFEVESIGQIDEHFEMVDKDKMDAEVFAKKVVKQAQEMEKHCPVKMAGRGHENFLSKISELFKSKVSWKKELNKRLNLFYSDNCGEKGRKKSIINYLWNPKSRYGILCKHHIETLIKKQAYIIFAVDTSGSCFYDKYEMKSFFTEVETVAKELEYTKKGRILTIQWDSEIVEGLKQYKKGDWKKYKVRGGGGTDPKCVFRYLKKVYKKQNGWYTVKENGINFLIENKKKLPLLVFLTDGCFFSKVTEKSLGVYKDSQKNILYFTRRRDMIYPKKNYITYE